MKICVNEKYDRNLTESETEVCIKQ